MTDQANNESANFINLGVVLNNAGEVLVVRRVKEEIGKEGKVLKWAFPGGKQKNSESRIECVEREVLDETGFKVKHVREISLRIHPDISVIIVYHLCKPAEEKAVQTPKQPWEIAEVKWVKPEELTTLFTTSLDPQVAKELKIG